MNTRDFLKQIITLISSLNTMELITDDEYDIVLTRKDSIIQLCTNRVHNTKTVLIFS